jgi:hypothetical protein
MHPTITYKNNDHQSIYIHAKHKGLSRISSTLMILASLAETSFSINILPNKMYIGFSPTDKNSASFGDGVKAEI